MYQLGLKELPQSSFDQVEAILLRDPSGAYAQSDQRTRRRYCRIIEEWALQSGRSSAGLAQRALDRARAAAKNPFTPPAAAHVGYYLVGPGARTFEAQLGIRLSPGEQVRRIIHSFPGPAYALLVAMLIGAELSVVLFYAAAHGVNWPVFLLIVTLGLPIFLAHQLPIARHLFRPLFPTRVLPKLAFEDGIPSRYRTLVVVPILFRDSEGIREQIRKLERLASADPDTSLRFALLSDFVDAPRQTMPEDAAILQEAEETLRRLNAQHRDALGDKFFILHRERRWSPVEGLWMGWERKRGKLVELNRLLCPPETVTTFKWIFGDFAQMLTNGRVRYVITLDADTWLEPSEARELVRTAAHPLNQPFCDAAVGRVTEGYGILQPTLVNMPPSTRTRFFNLMASHRAMIPPRERRARKWDFYQDVFGDGYYQGKGLYDVAAFQAVLDGALPQNWVLGHDKLEGLYARVGYVNDAFMIESLQTRYATHTRQMHRWMQGEWQLIPWLFSHVRDERGRWRKNPVTLSSKFRLLGWLLGHLASPAQFVFLVLAFTVFPGSFMFWLVVLLLGSIYSISIPLIRMWMTLMIMTARRGNPIMRRLGISLKSSRRFLMLHSLRILFTLALLPHEAWLATDALVRALWRMLISRKHLLEWTPQQEVERTIGGDLLSYLRSMWFSTACGLSVLSLAVFTDPSSLLIIAPFGGAWILAFWIAWYADLPQPIATSSIHPDLAR